MFARIIAVTGQMRMLQVLLVAVPVLLAALGAVILGAATPELGANNHDGAGVQTALAWRMALKSTPGRMMTHRSGETPPSISRR